jgi:biopolymer transport protein ExbB
MIQAFQAIEIAGEVEATLVAGGIKVALITTATGLAIAIPTQLLRDAS